jgi:hypothetical protein
MLGALSAGQSGSLSDLGSCRRSGRERRQNARAAVLTRPGAARRSSLRYTGHRYADAISIQLRASARRSSSGDSGMSTITALSLL